MSCGILVYDVARSCEHHGVQQRFQLSRLLVGGLQRPPADARALWVALIPCLSAQADRIRMICLSRPLSISIRSSRSISFDLLKQTSHIKKPSAPVVIFIPLPPHACALRIVGPSVANCLASSLRRRRLGGWRALRFHPPPRPEALGGTRTARTPHRPLLGAGPGSRRRAA